MKIPEEMTIILGFIALSGAIYIQGAVAAHAIGTRPSANWSSEEKREAPKTVNSLHEKGVQAEKAGDNRAAVGDFRQAKKKINILNMLAHAGRKTGKTGKTIEPG